MSPRKRRWFAVALAAAAGLPIASLHADAPSGSSADPATVASTARRPAAPVDPAPLRDAIQKLVSEVQGWGGTVGVSVVDLDSGTSIAAHNEASLLNPASNAKLVTAATALRRLGGSHRFMTGLYGKIVGGAVEELVLRGQGDPSLTTRDLWAMAHELIALGVRRVHAILVDQTFFDDFYVPPAFEAQPNEWAPFRAPVAPVSVNENTVLFTMVPTTPKHDALVSVDPPGFVDVTGAVRTTKKADPEGVTLALEAKGSRLGARLGGHVPEGDDVVRIARRVDDPRLLAGFALRFVLEQAGVTPSSAQATVKTGGDREKHLLVAHRSAPLGELLSALGKESDNFYAEMIFKTLGAEKAGRPGTHAGGTETAATYLREVNAFEEGIVLKNGSGLFDGDRLTPRSLTALLRAAYRDPAIASEYIGQLAIGGVDGTLKGRFVAWRSGRLIRAKTGTLSAVSALSGYVLAPPGKSPVAFSILVNGIAGRVADARGPIDRVVESIVKQLGS